MLAESPDATQSRSASASITNTSIPAGRRDGLLKGRRGGLGVLNAPEQDVVTPGPPQREVAVGRAERVETRNRPDAGLVGRCLQVGLEFGAGFLHHREEDRVPVCEVRLDRGGRDADPASDISQADGRFALPLLEQRGGGPDDVLTEPLALPVRVAGACFGCSHDYHYATISLLVKLTTVNLRALAYVPTSPARPGRAMFVTAKDQSLQHLSAAPFAPEPESA